MGLVGLGFGTLLPALAIVQPVLLEAARTEGPGRPRHGTTIFSDLNIQVIGVWFLLSQVSLSPCLVKGKHLDPADPERGPAWILLLVPAPI